MAKNGMPGPALWLSALLILIGASVASVGGWQTFQLTFELLAAESFEVPGSQTRDLAVGEYEAYGVVAENSVFNFDESTFRDQPTFFVDDIRVTNVDTGETVPLRINNTNFTLGRSTNVYAPVASFDITEAGRYEVAITSDQDSRSVFGRSVQSAPDRIVPWATMLAVGSLLAILGLIMLIVGSVRRGRLKRQSGYASGVGPAGYATPVTPTAVAPTYAPPQTMSPPVSAPAAPSNPATGPPPPPGGSPTTPVTQPTQDPNQPDTHTPWG